MESSILLMGDVAYDARFSVCNKRNTFRCTVTGHNYSPYYNVAVKIKVFPDFFDKIIVAKQKKLQP